MATKINSFRRLSLVGGLAIVVSTVINLIIRFIALTWVKVSPEFVPISLGPVIFWSVMGGIGATLVFYLVTRLASQPLPVYVIIAFTVYICTFIPDALLIAHNPPVSGITASAVIVLMSMHLAEASVMLITLVRAARLSDKV